MSSLITDFDHSLMAAYDLGASAQTLQNIYDDDVKYQRPIKLAEDHKKIETITANNWTEHLGDEMYAYVAELTNSI